jgi:hypothetical protein
MEYHPLPADMQSVTKKTADFNTEPFTMVSIPFAKLFKFTSFAAVFMLLVVPFVAERAMPGDVLYAVKVQFNEEVRGTLTFDTYQKVEWETERLNRRIAEARLLASEGRLTEEVEAEVADAVRVHSANAQREIATLRAQDEDAATIASIALDTTLEVQSTSLKGEEDVAIARADTVSIAGEDRPVNLIADAIDASRSEADGVKASSTLPAYDKLMARVEQNTTRIYELLGALREIIPSEELTEVTRRVEDTDRAILAATEMEDTEDSLTKQALVNVLQRSQRLIVYMTELMVVKTVDINTLIPVVLTEVEEDEQAGILTQEVVDQTIKLIAAYEVNADEDVMTKVEFALTEIELKTASMASSTEDFAVFTVYANEVLSLISDSLQLIEAAQEPEVVDVNTSDSTATSSATSTEESIEEVIEIEETDEPISSDTESEEPDAEIDVTETSSTTLPIQ